MAYYSGIVLADNPVAFYFLNDAAGSAATVTDTSGNKYNGTTNGGVTLGQTGLLAKDASTTAAKLDGSTGYISLPSTLNPGGWGGLTVEMWFTLPSLPTTNARLIANAHTDSDNLGFELALNSGGTSGFVAVGNGTGYGYAGWNSTLVTGNLYHYVMTYDGAFVRAYLNGTHVGSTALTGTIGTSTYPVNIGRNPAYSGDYANATMQAVAVYSDALSAAQIGAHYAAGSQGPLQAFVQIGGKAVESTAGSLSIQNQVGQRSTGSVQVWSALGTYWSYGSQVQAYDDSNTLVFAGFISKDKATKSTRQGQGYLEHQLTLMDNAYKADKRVVAGSWLNTSAGTIVQYILTNILADEGVTSTATSIAPGVTVTDVNADSRISRFADRKLPPGW